VKLPPTAEPDFELPADAVLVERATGLCLLCDSRFHDEPAWRFAAPAVPGGVGLVEARHVPTGT
jgi:hypothetical protein